MAWDKDVPAGSTKLRLADDAIRANNAAIDAVFNALLVAGDAITLTAAEINRAPIPAATVMLFGQNSAPTGWTRKADWQDGAMLCYAASGDPAAAGDTDPRATHTHGTGDYSITEAELPAHYHLVASSGGYTGGIGNSNRIAYLVNYGASYQNYTLGGTTAAANVGRSSSVGSGTAHNHGDTDASGAPYYQEVIAATKDAYA